MKIFSHPNLSNNWTCPLCKTKIDKPVILVPIVGTEKGEIMEANQYHVDCIELSEIKINGKNFLLQVAE